MQGRGRHTQYASQTGAAMTHKDGESHKIDYTRVGFETLDFFQSSIGVPSGGYSLSYFNSGTTVTYIVFFLTSEQNSAQRAPDGSVPVRKFTVP